MPQQFGTAYTLAAGNTQYEYVRQNTWEVIIAGIDSILTAATVTIPGYTLTQGELFHFNDRVKYATMPNPGNCTIEIRDAINPLVLAELWAWFKQIYDPNTRQMGLASTYKRQGQIFQYDPVGNLIRTATLTGVWPTTSPVPAGALDYSKQDPVLITLTLSVDQVSYDGLLASSGSVGGVQGTPPQG